MALDTAGARWFHGGVAGLSPGDLILPPAETGVVPGREQLAEYGLDVRGYLGPDVARDDLVYLTHDRILAWAYAAAQAVKVRCLYPDRGPWGALYTAEPVGPAETDPDLPALGIQCPRARVLRVYDPVVRDPGLPRLARAMLRGVDAGSDGIIRAVMQEARRREAAR